LYGIARESRGTEKHAQDYRYRGERSEWVTVTHAFLLICQPGTTLMAQSAAQKRANLAAPAPGECHASAGSSNGNVFGPISGKAFKDSRRTLFARKCVKSELRSSEKGLWSFRTGCRKPLDRLLL
jgi:hypothetical protein